jgi:hypothetical protein
MMLKGNAAESKEKPLKPQGEVLLTLGVYNFFG